LAVRQRIEFKVVGFVYHQSLTGQAPVYFANDCRLVSESDHRQLRSSDVPTCVVPRMRSRFGDSFSAAGPLWDALPLTLRNSDLSFDYFTPLTLRTAHQSAWMSKITNDGLTRSGTGCFIAVPIWQQWASKG